jgi:hypothetical protein
LFGFRDINKIRARPSDDHDRRIDQNEIGKHYNTLSTSLSADIAFYGKLTVGVFKLSIQLYAVKFYLLNKY